ncbi:hypothetical protein [Sinimarinibacterium sp. NLF-5-8]|uniref:hypothetical protein n=1 Tax=Sinimarinibacterium sp. NLF-5-8 TaxID=2698684 RepID=UPI00137BC003|nr:hypothetical protein [Sinimarinibacterium sp. NLF-5-8]QHS11293.1 hypothetical protein GT972_14810 [Sinimarinibacterium sp. NLF-5-8]
MAGLHQHLLGEKYTAAGVFKPIFAAPQRRHCRAVWGCHTVAAADMALFFSGVVSLGDFSGLAFHLR